MEQRPTSDDVQSSTAEKAVLSSYYSYTRPSLNGYMNVAVMPSSSATTEETSDTESERVGVFDYVLSSSQYGDNNCSSFSSTVSTAAGENDPGGSSFRQKWAQDMNSLANDPCCDNGRELTTFRCSSSDVHSQPTNDGSQISGTDDVPTDMGTCSELEEIVVHSEIQSRRASYERFNPDFPYPGVCRSTSAHEPATVFVTSINRSSSPSSSRAIDASDNRDVIERRSHQCTPSQDVTEQCDVDCQSESTVDKESSLDPVPLSRSAITPTPNIVYLQDWFGSRSLISDISDDRYGILPRSETGRRLLRKRQKREQRRAEDASTTMSENVNEYKGKLSVDELLAFINNAKITTESSDCKAPDSTPSKKERSIRRKKKQASDQSNDNDGASVSTVDTSSCSGYEAAASADSTADAESEISQPTTVQDTHSRSYDGVQNVDFESTVNDHDRFVVVQKKKKVRQPVSQLPQRYDVNRRLPYNSVVSSRTVRNEPVPQAPAGYETCRADDTVSLISDTDSTSGYRDPHDSSSKTASIRCSSPDFPDLVVQGCALRGRRNSTGNVCENVGISEKLPLPTSYAIVAAGGMRPNPTVDIEWRHSFDSSAATNSHPQAEQLGVSSSSTEQEYFCSSSMSVEYKSDSNMLPEDLHDTISQTCVDNDNSEPGTPTGYYSADSRSVVSDDLANELHAIKLQKASKRLQGDSAAAVPVSTAECTGSLDRKTMLGCDRRTRLPASPVVFLDIANEHRPIRNNLGVSFGFDSSDSVCNVAQIECSSSESGFSDCTVHTDVDKISSVASTDSATSPVDPQDFIPTETIPSSMVQTVTVGHCRPIVPFLATTSHQTCSHPPVGIVPPIPQVDRAAESVEQDTAKDSKQDIMRSVINRNVEKDDILHQEAVTADRRFQCEKSLSTDPVSPGVLSRSVECSLPAGGFNLHTAQIFLYTAYEETLSEKNQRGDSVLRYYSDASM